MASGRIQFCSVDSTISRESTAGSAWYTPELIVCELPLPWGGDTLRSRNIPAGLADVVNAAYERRGFDWGLIGCAPDDAWSVPGFYRLMHCTIAPDSLGRFVRHSYLVPHADITNAVDDLLRGRIHASMDEIPDTTRDVLLCTHGSVDACCAKFGYPLYALMRKMADNAGSNVRVWRSTHFGGHRFAPTFLDLPSGRYWGRISAQDASALLHQTRPAATFQHLYRGSATMPDPLAQAIEAEILAHIGWVLDEAAIERLEVQEIAGHEWLAACTVLLASGDRLDLEVSCRQTGTVSLKGHCNYDILIDAPQFETSLRLVSTAATS